VRVVDRVRVRDLAHGYDPGQPLNAEQTGREGVKEATVPFARIDILEGRPPEVIEDAVAMTRVR
jgi:hypothetical protein